VCDVKIYKTRPKTRPNPKKTIIFLWAIKKIEDRLPHHIQPPNHTELSQLSIFTMSADLITLLSERLTQGSGIYLDIGGKMITASVYFNPFEIHVRLPTPVVVTTFQEFYRLARSSVTVWDSVTPLGELTDQELLNYIYYRHQVYEREPSPGGYIGRHHTLTHILSVPVSDWLRQRQRHEKAKNPLFQDIFKRISQGTEVLYMEPGFPAVTLTLEKDNHYRNYAREDWDHIVQLVASEHQPAGIDCSGRRFDHPEHLKNWYRKHVTKRNPSHIHPLYCTYFTSGSHRGLTLGQYLDSKKEGLFLTASKDGKEIFPAGSEHFKAFAPPPVATATATATATASNSSASNSSSSNSCSNSSSSVIEESKEPLISNSSSSNSSSSSPVTEEIKEPSTIERFGMALDQSIAKIHLAAQQQKDRISALETKIEQLEKENTAMKSMLGSIKDKLANFPL